MKDEAAVWDMIRGTIGGCGEFDRLESHMTSIGFPDVAFCIEGSEGHLELKHVKDLSIKPHIRPAQWGWFRRRVRCGGRPFVAVGTKDGAFYLVEGKYLLSDLTPESNGGDWTRLATRVWDHKPLPLEILEIILHEKVR